MSPYPVKIYLVEMRGSLLEQVLNQGRSASVRGEGGFLQLDGAEFKGGKWFVGNPKEEVTDSSNHRVAIGDYLLKGNERAFGGFLNPMRKDVGELSYAVDQVALKASKPLVGDLAALFVEGLNKVRLGELTIEPSTDVADPPLEDKVHEEVVIRAWPRRADSRPTNDP